VLIVSAFLNAPPTPDPVVVLQAQQQYHPNPKVNCCANDAQDAASVDAVGCGGCLSALLCHGNATASWCAFTSPRSHKTLHHTCVRMSPCLQAYGKLHHHGHHHGWVRHAKHALGAAVDRITRFFGLAGPPRKPCGKHAERHLKHPEVHSFPA